MTGTMNTPESFWGRVVVSEPAACWLWTGAQYGRPEQRYGQISWHGEAIGAHRVSWELTNGAIPDGLVIDHLCRNRLCVNPSHLRVTTQRENILTGTGVAARFAARSHCGRGHSLADAYPRGDGGRRCRGCALEDYRLRRRGPR